MRMALDIDRRFLTMRTVEAPSIRTRTSVVTPLARTMVLRCGHGFVIRSRPLAVVVAEEGRTSRIRIMDLNFLIQAAIVVGLAACTFGLLARSCGRKENKP